MKTTITILLFLLTFFCGAIAALLLQTPPEARAEEKKDLRYPFLSESFNAPHIFTRADYEALWMTARFNCEEYLTDKLMRTCLIVSLMPGFEGERGAKRMRRMIIIVGTKCQSDFEKHYEGNGRWFLSKKELRQIYAEAARDILEKVRMVFPLKTSNLSDKDILIKFSIWGSPVGTWNDGKLKLVGEE